MEIRKSFFKNPLLIAVLAAPMLFAVACGDDDDSSPTPSGGTKATGGTGGSDNMGGAPVTMGGKNGTAGTTMMQVGGGGAGMDMAGAPGMGGAGPENCTDDTDMGCYSCAPKTLDQFLNACPTEGCEPFDNSTLTSLPASGKLPKLP